MQHPPKAYPSLLVLYFALLGSLIFFSVAIYFVSGQQEPAFGDTAHREILVTCLLLTTICLGVMGFVWKKDLVRVRSISPLPEKFRVYRSACIKAYALHEGPAIFALVCYFLTHNIRFLVIVGVIIAGFLLIYPSARRVAGHMGVAEDELRELEA